MVCWAPILGQLVDADVFRQVARGGGQRAEDVDTGEMAPFVVPGLTSEPIRNVKLFGIVKILVNIYCKALHRNFREEVGSSADF